MKKFKFVVPLFVILAAISASTITMLGAGSRRAVVDPKPIASPNMIQDEHAPALISIAALYAPIGNHDTWMKQVCAGMTKDGCEYFKSNQANSIWQSQVGHDGDSVGGNISDVIVISDTAQVWKAQVIIYSNAEEFKNNVFVLVEHESDGWYLNRVLYGPGISQ